MAQLEFKDNPKFALAYHSKAGNVSFYIPSSVTDYHKSREMAMAAQDSYSRCGISRDVLQSFTDKMLEIANKQLNMDTVRTDIGVIANNLRFRMSEIVDEQCTLRMAALSLFIDGENPDEVSEAWTLRKLKYAAEFPDIRSFFLGMGVALTPQYNSLCRGLEIEEYLRQRQMAIDGLTLQDTPVSS